MAMRNIFPSISTLCRAPIGQQWQRFVGRSASTSASLSSSPLYEFRCYAIQPSKFKAALDLFAEKFHLRTNHSKLFGFWTSEIGDNISQVVHIWEYDSLSHRREVRTALAGDPDWNSDFVTHLTPRIIHWENALLVTRPGSVLNVDFKKDPSAVYLMDRVKVDNYNHMASEQAGTNPGELLVGSFCGVLGPSKTEYRLWRYADIDQATEASISRASDASFEGDTMLLYPFKVSPLQ